MERSGRTHHAKRLSEAAYDALLESLSVSYWYRRDFEDFLRSSLDDAPELLATLNFDAPKRQVAGELVARLRRSENRYQGVTIGLLLRLSEFDRRFPRLARLEDGAVKVALAQAALDEVVRIVEQYGEVAEARARLADELRIEAEASAMRRTHAVLMAELRDHFMEMYNMSDAHNRGRLFETLLNDLFGLFDLHPRAAYSIEHEQIDGAFTFDTDDYLLEAKWWATPLEPHHLHVLKAKIETKAKNVLGLFIGVNGFTEGAIEKYSHGTPLILMDGTDLFAVLESRISLTELLERKRRHAAETGRPMLSVTKMLT